MHEENKTNAELIEEIQALRREVTELRASERQLQVIFEKAPVGISHTAIDGRLRYMNRKFCEIVGYSQDELREMSYEDLTHPDDLAADQAATNRVLAGEAEGFALEKRYLRKDGTCIWVDLQVSLVRDAAGEPDYFVAVVQDITQRKQMAEALQHERDLLRTLIDNIPDTIYFKDTAGRFTMINQAQAEMLGLDDSEEAIGRTDFDYFTADHAQDAHEDEKQIIATGHPIDGKIERVRRADGKFRWVTITKIPIKNRQDDVVGVAGISRDITERKRAQDALRKSKSLFQSLVESMPQSVFSKDLMGRFTFANQRYCKMEGKSLAEIVGQTDFDLHPLELARQYREDDQRVMELEEVLDRVEVHQPIGGEPFYVQVIKTPIYDAEGQVIGLLGMFWDITERKRMEQALREREERLQLAMDAAEHGFWDWNMDTNETYFSPRYYTMLGYEPVELPMELSTWEDLLHPEDRREVAPRILEKAMAAEAFEEEFRMRAKSGAWRWIRGRGKPFEVDEQGVPHRAVGTHEDITARKRAEQAMRESEARYRQLVETSPDAILLTEPNSTILMCNQQAAVLYECEDCEQLVGRRALELVAPVDHARVRSNLQRLLSGEEVKAVEYTVQTAQGNEIFIELHSSVIKATDNHPQAIISVARDVTERHEMAQQLQRQERLAAVGQLAAGIAHDFRNILSTIILYAQLLLRKSNLPLGAARSLQTIIDESYKATDLVQQILDFSSRAMIKPRELDLVDLIKKTVEVLLRTLPESIHLALDAPDAAPGSAGYTVMADEGRIQQALTNLALNARDAMPQGGELRFTLSIMRVKRGETPPVAEMSPGRWICLAVSDTGTGMTEEVREHLFEPFFTTKEVGKGTGLGLAQVFGIVRQHEGYIDVATELGAGTTFSIYLPFYHEADTEEQVPEASSLPQGRGETILLVEDEVRLREAGKAMLTSLGYRVKTAANGREALTLCKKAQSTSSTEDDDLHIDLVITDLVMPQMGGKALMHELRRMNSPLKVLAITGYALQEEDTTSLRSIGFVDIIIKPFDFEELAQVIRSALDEPSSQ
ncbi:MAG: PAS domain S-box protein [Anaerolineales bacterium]